MSAAGAGDNLCPFARRPLHLVPIPLVRLRNGPVHRFVRMAAATGIGHAKFFSEPGVRNREAVIMASVPLHERRLRHVAIHTIITALSRLMMRVGGGIDFGRGRQRCAVAGHA